MDEILASLAAKLSGLPWPRAASRQRQQHWHKGYLIQSHFDGLPPKSPGALVAALVVAATHSTADRTTLPILDPPHPRLAATGPP
jgi:hypothetical protein